MSFEFDCTMFPTNFAEMFEPIIAASISIEKFQQVSVPCATEADSVGVSSRTRTIYYIVKSYIMGQTWMHQADDSLLNARAAGSKQSEW